MRGWGKPGGRPVLCWHGVGVTNRASRFLSEAGPLLAERHDLRILALDAPGFGRSPPLAPEAYHPHTLVDLVPPLLDELALASAGFLGYSWGADVGCHLVARHPDRVSALVLLDAGYSDPPLDPSASYAARLERWEREWQKACAPSWDAVLGCLRDSARRWSPALEEGRRAGWREQGGRLVPTGRPWVVAAVEHGMARNPPSGHAILAATGIPVLVIVAGDAPEEDVNRFATKVSRAEIRRVDGSGHDVLTDGGPEVVHAIGRWLAANVPEG